MAARRVVEDIPATPHFDFLYGRYHLSSWVIPYFSTTMSLRDAATNLRLATDFPGSDDVKWKLEELDKREVDWPRVECRIVPYLRATTQPQFFNALTIALLPAGHSLSDTQQAFATQRKWRPPALAAADRFPKVLTVGPVTCGYWADWDDFSQAGARTGQLRWNPEEVFAVALDGQHRLAAIQQFLANPGVSDDQLRATSVPVIFVALDRRFGYEAAVSKSLVDVLRVIFIDLNKHARIPTRARQILLDDKDPTSVCVRALVGETVTGDTTDLEATPARLPLALVDWHTEQAKFDEGPYVTTILTLDWAITALLGAKPVQDFMDYGAVRKQMQALYLWLRVDMDSAFARLDDLEAVKFQPFSYSESAENDELDRISRAFQRIWNPVFISLLTDFTPYRELIAFRQANGSFTLDFANWYRLYHRQKSDPYEERATAEYRRFLVRIQTGANPVGEAQIDSLRAAIEARKANLLAYNVVFQRAYFLAFHEWNMVDEAHLDDLEDFDAADVFFDDEAPDDGEHDEEASDAEDSSDDGADATTEHGDAGPLADHVRQRAEEYVRCLNNLVDRRPEILRSDCVFPRDDEENQRFWLGTLETADGVIDFTQDASLRARDVIFWAVAMQMYGGRVAPEERSDFDDFWADVLESNGSYMKRIRRSVKRFAEREGSAGDRILEARGEEFDRDNSTEEARLRMRWLWAVMGL